jgi:hypothetical protein
MRSSYPADNSVVVRPGRRPHYRSPATSCRRDASNVVNRPGRDARDPGVSLGHIEGNVRDPQATVGEHPHLARHSRTRRATATRAAASSSSDSGLCGLKSSGLDVGPDLTADRTTNAVNDAASTNARMSHRMPVLRANGRFVTTTSESGLAPGARWPRCVGRLQLCTGTVDWRPRHGKKSVQMTRSRLADLLEEHGTPNR